MFDGVIETTQGKVRGSDVAGCWAYKGVPYASAPVGPLRFRPPVPAESWSGIRTCDLFGPIAPQPASALGSYFPGDPRAQDEDCLSLNIWTAGPGGEPRPVMVFIHGGAYMIGSGAQVLYEGSHLARRGAVVVTFNYRLGVLGFLAHPLLAEEAGGFANWGLMDQIAALRWVKENIERFGGDADNVTIFGESAGAMSVCDLLGMPSVHGLFRRAIAQSGATYALPVEPAAHVAERVFDELALGLPSRDELERLPVAALISAQLSVNATVDAGIGLPFRPVVDGGLIVRHPAVEIANGSSSGVDLMIGTNRDEFRFFSAMVPDFASIDEQGIENVVGRYLAGGGLSGLDPRLVVATYAAARRDRGSSTTPRALLDAIVTDWIFRVPALRLATTRSAHASNTFVYRFDWESPFGNGALGACHCLELPFVFETFQNPVVSVFAGASPDARRLGDEMASAWVAFAGTGVPDCAEIAHWSGYESARRSTMCFGMTSHLEDAPAEAERVFWEEHLGRYGVDGPIEGATPPSVSLLASPVENLAGA